MKEQQKVLEKAVRILDNNEKTWEEFQDNHPEIIVLCNVKGDVVDVDFSSKVTSPTIHKINGIVESINFCFNNRHYVFPIDYKF